MTGEDTALDLRMSRNAKGKIKIGTGKKDSTVEVEIGPTKERRKNVFINRSLRIVHRKKTNM